MLKSAGHGWTRRLTEAEAGGELIHVEAFMAAMGWSRAQLDNAVSKYRVFLIDWDHTEFVPRFFCDSRFDARQVQLVSAALGTVTPGGKWQFFTTGKGSLGGCTPLVALSQGRLRAVRRAARAYAER